MSTWIPLLVRAEDYRELAGVVAAKEADRPEGSAPTNAEVRVALGEEPRGATKAAELLMSLKPWSLDELRQIIHTAPVYKTMARWARAMDVASEHPGPTGFLSTSQMASASGMSINEWRDAPRKLPQHLTAHFRAGIEWPLRAVGGRDLGKDDQVYWGITLEQAKRWKQVRGETDASESR